MKPNKCQKKNGLLIRENNNVGSYRAEEYGLTVGIHAHAAGFMDFEPELERLLQKLMKKYLRYVLILDIIHMLGLILWNLCKSIFREFHTCILKILIQR